MTTKHMMDSLRKKIWDFLSNIHTDVHSWSASFGKNGGIHLSVTYYYDHFSDNTQDRYYDIKPEDLDEGGYERWAKRMEELEIRRKKKIIEEKKRKEERKEQEERDLLKQLKEKYE